MRKRQILRALPVLLSLHLVLGLSMAFAQPDGKAIFKANCASCHKIDKKLTGPALRGARDRAPSEEWLLQWVKNSQSLVKAGDAYAVQLFNEYNGTIMTPNALTDEEIIAVFDYIDAEPLPSADQPGSGTTAAAEVEEDSNALWWLSTILIILLIIIGVLNGVRRSLQNVANERKGLGPLPEGTIWEETKLWMARNKKFTVLVIIVVLGMLSVEGWYALKGVGVYEGYAPEQPIAFSHKIHAGDNSIDCVYCHHSAEKGKNAGIPSVNVCMNCHKGIPEGPTTGTKEIAKIYAAAGWNPETNDYDLEPKPIKWVRIHNLPDFAYFNHSQHVVVGKIECQKCHGEVEEFGYPMKQHAPLTMGWCVDCHRETPVQMDGNEYYDEMHRQLVDKYHEQGEDGKIFTVEDIGGLECAKCHY